MKISTHFVLPLSLLLSVSVISPVLAESSDLETRCTHGVLAEIYTAKAASFKSRGSTQPYEIFLSKAREQGAALGYSDYGIDLMVNAMLKDINDASSIDYSLSKLDDSQLVISPLIDDCLTKPEAYIRNYTD